MPHFKGGCHISPGEGGGQAAGGVWKSREGAEGGADSTMDGDFERSRLGKERQMPYGLSGRFESVERGGALNPSFSGRGWTRLPRIASIVANIAL